MRRRSVVAVCVLLLAACSGDGGGRADEPGGGGQRVVEADDLVAMAVEGDGTRWFVDAAGDVLRADGDGELTTELSAAAGVRLTEHAAMAVTLEGVILVVSDAGDGLHRFDPGEVGAGLTTTTLAGVPDGAVLTGVAAGPDGTVFVVDGMTGTLYDLATGDGVASGGTATAEPVAGTPDASCRARVRPPVPVGLAVTPGGDPVVADPSCGLYVPGDGPLAETPDCLDSPDAAAFPITAAIAPPVVDDDAGDDDEHEHDEHDDDDEDDVQIVVGGRFCELVWRVPASGGDPVGLAGDAEIDGFPRAVAVDASGIVHVLDDRGVVTFDLPG